MHEQTAPSTDRNHNAVMCPLCERIALQRRQCKSQCAGCGYVESCEDNFVPNQANPID